MNREIMKAAGFGAEVEQVESGNCPLCKSKIKMKDFKDDLSKREFKISGICQKCQDKVFG